MSAIYRFAHTFTDVVPAEIEEGILYVSLQYALIVHLCACGCRTKVVCNLDPADYALAFDGESITIWPSIGNWDFYCRSHYNIQCSYVRWVPQMSHPEVTAARVAARRAKKQKSLSAVLPIAWRSSILNQAASARVLWRRLAAHW
ncbi:DUF6527 family protein [Mycobacterium paraffinicum]|uniref:DUF6527 family protein n=1 Tax=Mycobacterium paraffinicum TaxID=53378 RepID=UPI001114F3DA|nr:DUF6527 family protein [Mycobacterium paraffinicum]